MKKVLAALAAASWLAACGGSNTTTPTPTGPQQYDQTQKPVTPKGTIYGRVIDVSNQNPLEGVSVKVLGSDATLTTAADGTFKLENAVVNSSYGFIFEKMGYLRTRTSAQVPGSTGNSPLEGGITSFSIEMFPTTGSVTGFVFLPNGRPAPNATVYVDQRNFGESVVTAQTGADGAFTLSGLATRPSGAGHNIFAQWFDENGDMQADYGTTSTNVTVFPGQPARTFITYNGVALRLVASNIVDGEIPAGEDLQFTFSTPLFTGTLLGMTARPWVLTNNTVGNNIDVPVEGTFMSPTVLRVRPALNSLQEGQRYTISLALRAASLSQGTSNDFNQSFDFQVRAANVMPYTTQVTGLTVVNQNPSPPYADTAFDYNHNQFTISFVPAAGAVRYEIYARDTASIPNFTRVGNVITANGAPRYQQNVTLNSPFTTNFASGLFASGNRVTFAVVGIDAYGSRAPLMSAPTVEVRDTIPPRILSGPTALPSGTTPDGINDGTTAATIQLRITYSEPMDPASMVTYTSNATNAPMAAFRWDSSASNSGVLTLTVGAGNDATGSFVIRGGKDSSGNDLQQAGDLVGFLGGRRELLQTPDFQSGTMCALGSSWVASSLNGGPTPTAINNNGSITGNVSPCAAVLGSVPGGMPGTGRSRILQGISLPSLMNTGFSIQANARYRTVNVVNQAQPGATYTMRCFFADTNDAPLLGLGLFSSSSNMTSFTTAGPLNLSAQQNTSIRLICETENTNMMAPGFGALYLDEMSVALVKNGTL